MKTLLNFFDDMSLVLSEYTEGDIFPNIELSIPKSLHSEVLALFQEAAKNVGEVRNPDPYGQFGKWHVAANILQHRLNDRCKEINGHRIPLGDWSHRALMKVAREML